MKTFRYFLAPICVAVILATVADGQPAGQGNQPVADQKKAADPPVPPTLTLTINAPDTVAAGDLAKITVDSSSTATDIQWTVAPSPVNPDNWDPHPAKLAADASADLCSGTAGGTFTVIAAGNLNGQTILTQTTIVFTGGTPIPPQPPSPNKLFIVTVNDAAKVTAAQKAVMSDAPFWKSVSVAGHEFTTIQVSDPAAAPWKALMVAANVAAPAIFFLDQKTNKVVEVDPYPNNEADLDSIIRKITGKAVLTAIK